MTAVIIMVDSTNHKSVRLNRALLHFSFKKNVVSADMIEVYVI